MGKAKPVTILDKKFATQKAAENYVRNYLNSLKSLGIIDASSEHWSFLYALFSRHSDYEEKKGTGILKFLIGLSEEGHIQLDLVRTDNSPCDVSWLKCISGKATSILTNLKSAMRQKVQSQIDYFKSSNYAADLICDICHEKIGTFVNSNADHITQFETLVNEFLLEHPDYPVLFDDNVGSNKAKFKDVDIEFAQYWFNFHQNRADLRIVHEGCNLRRKRA